MAMAEKRKEDDQSAKQMELQNAIKVTNEAVKLCLCNKFTEAQNLLKPHAGESMYHALGYATIAYLQAVMTYEQEVIQMAYKAVKNALEVCDRSRRKQSWTESFYSLVGRPYFDDYTEVEIHAELCYAECLLERAILTFIQDENLINFIKGGLKIRNAYYLYRSCLQVMNNCPESLSSSDCRTDFEGGVHLGIGTFNLLISLLPARILRLLEWVGFSGDKRFGLNHLDQGVQKDGLRSPLCTITLLAYHVVASPILGIGDTDVKYAEDMLQASLDKFPEGAIFLFYAGRLLQIQGRTEEAITRYQQAVSVNVEWKQVHHVCYWELMWCHSFQAKWRKAAEFASLLSKESRWSKTAYLYIEAAFRIMAEVDTTDESSKDETEINIEDILRQVPQHKQRIAGKSLPFEKFAVHKANKHLEKDRKLLLPGLELIYVWNGFVMFGSDRDVMNHFLKLICSTLEDLEKNKDQNGCHTDDYCLTKLLQGVCLRYLGYSDEAEGCFREVTKLDSQIKYDKFLAPYACAEIGFLYKANGRYDEAASQLEEARKRYSGYHLESRLHFRIHSSLQAMKDKELQPEQVFTSIQEASDSHKLENMSENDNKDNTPDKNSNGNKNSKKVPHVPKETTV